ncbi:hypothetical protein F5I97DRAFT_1942374 [Phlebopus sp. FC_14]|nr:hypothetical protein F5I97DRAFT_1942374 [Phlebopus sp. FC_14]
MAPKNKGKKGKGGGDDDYWEKAGVSVANNQLATEQIGGSDNDHAPPKSKAGMGFSAFSALQEDDGPPEVDENEDFGGLMSAIKATAARGKKDKKKKKVEQNFDDEPVDETPTPVVDNGPVEMTADDLADEEWGPSKDKGKKGKKGKGKQGKTQDEDEEAPKAEQPTPAPAAEQTPEPKDADDEDADTGPTILSKKEKEKLKKEREKAKKKAQAEAKKTAAAAEAPPPATPVIPAPGPKAEKEGDGDADAADAGGSGAKKKKKKKGKKDEDSEAPAPAPALAPAAGKKKGGLSALKAMMEEKKRLEEEARRREEEERRRIEEEERRAEEEAKRKEEEKQRRKEKEKAKRELAKKEGRLLTKKQKEEKAAAELRRQALLASGVQIEGLQQQTSGNGAPTGKKVVYGNRKKKAPTAKDSAPASPVPESRPLTPETVPEPSSPSPAVEEPAVKANDVKDDWDASSEEETETRPAEPFVKDSWDASSDEEGVPQPSPAKVPAAPAKSSPTPASPKLPELVTKPTAAPPNGAVKTSQPVAPAPRPPAPKAQEESEESESEESSSEEDSDEDSDESSLEESDDGMTKAQRFAAQRKAEAAERRAKAHEAALAAGSKDNLRSPICCILGHVDTGKTKLLDKIRQTNVQEGEAGGITQQIGATYFPVDAIKTKTAVLNKDNQQEYKVPGLLVIDTPGHESFTNLRSRGSSLCNIAILVVDIMHGLEQQTLESLRLLRDRKTPFIVALNKIDRMYGWEATPDGAFQESLAKQKRSVQREFEDRVQKTILAFAEQGLNAVLYYENKNFARNVSLVPTSAITGEGVPDMIMLLVNLTQQRMSDRLMYLSELECTVLEVKVIEGLGTTIDVVLSNGILREGDKIVVCGLNGPIVTQVRALLTPQPLRELRVKSAYVHHKEVKAALGVKVVAPDLEKAIAGSRLLVVGPDDDEEDMLDEVMSDLTSLLNSIDKSGRGVCVQASTLGSLEALLDFLKVSKIPVSGINIGPVHKKDVMRCATMLEKAKELAVILCFDVPVDKDAEKLAEEMGIRLFKADIIYHLFDAFTAYNNEIMEAKRRDAAPQAVWPCRLKTIATFCKRDPIILGVDILDGTLRVGTPICVVKVDPTTQKKEIIDLGKITSLEINHKAFDVGTICLYCCTDEYSRLQIVKKSQAGGGVAVKIEHAVYQSAKMFGRHFDDKDELLSHITRQSIDVLKSSFKADVSTEEWLLIKALKPRFLLSFSMSASSSSVGHKVDSEQNASVVDRDALQLKELGYKQQLHRSWHLIESFAASFVSLNFIGGVRSFFFLGLLAGGPAAIWSSYIITMIFMFITAAVLAEICSALPLSGSIYVWAAESAGPKYARFFGFLVAWWACTAWMTFTASNCQTTANYVVSQLAVWDIDFPGGIGSSNVQWRAFVWGISELMLLVSVAINYLPPKVYSGVFKFSVGLMMLDFFLCLIWLPIGVSKTYGFRSASEVFTMTYNGTGAPAGWNWLLSFLFTAGTLTGFDASGHIAEETKNARYASRSMTSLITQHVHAIISVIAAKGILSGAILTGCFAFVTIILFLFCTPDLDTIFALDAPQPFVQIYALALGKKASIFMTVIAVLGLIMNTTVAIVASSRLVFAVARDGVLPLSGWIGKVDSKGQPRNAITVIYIFAAALLCTILPSQVAFTSLVSAGAVPTIAAYALIALLRLIMTPNHFQSSHFRLGKYAKPFYICAAAFNGLIFAVDISPFVFPVTAETFNFAVVIFGAISIFAFLSWYFTPEEKWLRRDQILKALRTADREEH